MNKSINIFNNTQADFPAENTLNKIFEEQAEIRCDEIAIIYGSKNITYKELNSRANQLARKLVAKGVGRGDVIALQLKRSIYTLIGIFAVLKTGSAYLPIGYDESVERIKFIIKSSKSKILLTDNNVTLDYIETCNISQKSIYYGDQSDLNINFSSNNLAYIIYTSGSTGLPKGVMIEHKSVINNLNWMNKKYNINHSDIILYKTPYTFDVSVWELFLWYFLGAKLCILDNGEENNPETLVNIIDLYKISLIHFVPCMLQVFIEYVKKKNLLQKLGSLKKVFASGEVLKISTIQLFNKSTKDMNIELHNLYGPTEATIHATYYYCNDNRALIGKPVDNTKIYILDEEYNECLIGETGEIYISGTGVARGYLNDDDLTAQRFLPEIYNPNYKMYKTGDLGKWLPDGNIEYIGRIDNQIKINGYRIELEEIENIMMEYCNIKQTIVTISGINRLVAYYTSENSFDDKVINKILIKYLPQYMIPNKYVRVSNFKYTPSGKLERKNLDTLDIISENETDEIELTQTEKQILDVINSVLSDKYKIEVNCQMSFNEAGLGSLAFIKIIINLEEMFSFKFDYKLINSFSDIKSIVRYVETKIKEI